MQTPVRSEDVSRAEEVVAPFGCRDTPARLGDDEPTGGDVPRREPTLVERGEAARADVREIQSRRREAPHASGFPHHAVEHRETRGVAPASVRVRDPDADDRTREVPMVGDADPLPAQPRATTALRRERLALCRIVNHPGDDRTLAFEGHRDREMGHPV
ncbi:MAG TPA: hypothetical protein VIY73_12815, partial [Polyangiaceae bacterium]